MAIYSNDQFVFKRIVFNIFNIRIFNIRFLTLEFLILEFIINLHNWTILVNDSIHAY